jgi:hypothetical protein
LILFASMAVLSAVRWAEEYHLFILGSLSFAAGSVGRRAVRRGQIRIHLIGMGSSYILLLTAFYVDNGAHLPFWKELPAVTYWLLPAAIGIPLLIRTLRRHPPDPGAILTDQEMTEAAVGRPALVRRGLWLNYLTIGYNTIEAVVSLAAGLVAGSVALVGFGIDSAIEVTASLVAQWRLRSDHLERRERAEQVTGRVIGGSFVVLAAYIAADSTITLWHHEAPRPSVVGLVILALSVVVMPVLARAKRRVAHALASRALQAEAMQTSLCAYLSVIALAGVALNTALGWWWADPVAALLMVPLITKEGLEGLRGSSACDHCGS